MSNHVLKIKQVFFYLIKTSRPSKQVKSQQNNARAARRQQKLAFHNMNWSGHVQHIYLPKRQIFVAFLQEFCWLICLPVKESKSVRSFMIILIHEDNKSNSRKNTLKCVLRYAMKQNGICIFFREKKDVIIELQHYYIKFRT